MHAAGKPGPWAPQPTIPSPHTNPTNPRPATRPATRNPNPNPSLQASANPSCWTGRLVTWQCAWPWARRRSSRRPSARWQSRVRARRCTRQRRRVARERSAVATWQGPFARPDFPAAPSAHAQAVPWAVHVQACQEASRTRCKKEEARACNHFPARNLPAPARRRRRREAGGCGRGGRQGGGHQGRCPQRHCAGRKEPALLD